MKTDIALLTMELQTDVKKLAREFTEQAELAIVHERNYLAETALKEVADMKEPYLKELLDSMRGQPLEAKYTASDILTVLESVESLLEKYKVAVEEE